MVLDYDLKLLLTKCGNLKELSKILFIFQFSMKLIIKKIFLLKKIVYSVSPLHNSPGI
jgi:hypothetical protein